MLPSLANAPLKFRLNIASNFGLPDGAASSIVSRWMLHKKRFNIGHSDMEQVSLAAMPAVRAHHQILILPLQIATEKNAL